MKLLTGVLFALSGLLAIQANKANDFSMVDLYRQALIELELDLWKDLSDPQWNEITKPAGGDLEVIRAYQAFGDKLEETFPSFREDHLNSLSSLWLWARAQSEMRGIEGLYTTFRRMQRQVVDGETSIDTRAWRDLAETVLDDATASVPVALDRIAKLIVEEKLFVSAYQEGSKEICNSRQSPQQLLYSLYKTIAMIELKGYAMMQFSWILLRVYEKGNFSEEAQLMRKRYQTRTTETLRAVRTAMTFAPRDLWTCDPALHQREETYTELTQLLQSYIVNEVDLNTDNTCRENCGYYSYAKVSGCYKNGYCSQQRKCNGMLYDCQYVDSDMWICPAEKSSSRRYEYIEYENGRIFGQKGTCTRGTTKVDSWWRWIFWHCSYCVCFCDDHSRTSDRYINMRNVVADIKENKVITGMRFVKANRVIHLQIQQGELLPRGGINKTTIQWKPIDNYTISDPDVIEKQDYLTLSWEQRAIDLDDLTAREGYLLTGVRFRRLGSHLNLEMMSTPFNFTSGSLLKPHERSEWHGNDNTDVSLTAPRTLLDIKKPDVPTRSQAPSIPDSKTDQYVLLKPSDLDKDAAQSTVPFIDIQPVIPDPPIPLAGAGIYHKGRKGYGGYIAPKLITYNFARHLHADFPPLPPIVSVNNEIQDPPAN